MSGGEPGEAWALLLRKLASLAIVVFAVFSASDHAAVNTSARRQMSGSDDEPVDT